MESNELSDVVANVYIETRKVYEDAKGALGKCHDHGFKILYSPARFRPDAVIVGFQPGGDIEHTKPTELLGPSVANEYLSMGWPLATELRKRFGAAYLERAVGTNAIFFRSPSLAQWKAISKPLRRSLEEFSIHQTRRLIDAMKPKQILILGWDTLDLFKEDGFVEKVANDRIASRKRRKRLLQKGRIMGVSAFAIPHPSAAWKYPTVTEEDWLSIATPIVTFE